MLKFKTKMGRTMHRYLFAAVSLILCTLTVAQIEVTTNNGKVKGITHTNNGKLSYEFRGIPFAKPPVGNLRFKKPEPVANWTGTKNATKFGYPCWQPEFPLEIDFYSSRTFSEDCLFLNIHVPGNLTVNRAVMVWIHGGGYQYGSGDTYDGQELAAAGDVIVVTINYRLGVFGFGTTGDATLPGNLGMWDQVMALQWVNTNIGKFGGDNSRITIFGESAGAGSVNVLSIAPKVKGLFQRVIGQSGAALSPWAVVSKENGVSALTKTANALNCTTESSAKMVECLGKIDAEKLKNISALYSALPDGTIPFAPTVDGDFLIEEPKKTFTEKTSEAYKLFASLDVIGGFNDAEGIGSVLMDPILVLTKLVNIDNGLSKSAALNFTARMAQSLTPAGADTNAVENAINAVYVKATDEATLAQNIIYMYGDLHFLVPTVEVMNSRDQTAGKSYMYSFGYFRPNNTLRAIPSLPYKSWVKGASHGDEIPFVFGLAGLFKNQTFTADEIGLSTNIMKMWTNFAKTGNPGKGWTEYDSVNKRYMDLNTAQTMKANVAPERVKLLLKTLPDIYARKHISTKQPTSNAVNLQISVIIMILSTFLLHI